MNPRGEDILDEALELLSTRGADTLDDLTNHGPMTAEALVRLGRWDALPQWLEAYARNLKPRMSFRETIKPDDWRGALGRSEREGDWEAFFRGEIERTSWRECIALWTDRLKAGFCSDALHGVIRVGHAARGLGHRDNELRRRELAAGFARWAASYQELPAMTPVGELLSPSRAILRVMPIAPEKRNQTRTIVEALEQLKHEPDFASACARVDVGGAPGAVLSEMSLVFARVFAANVHSPLEAIIFTHGVTGIVALRNLLPCLKAESIPDLMRFAWQASCALFVRYGTRPQGESSGNEMVNDILAQAGRPNREDLVRRALAGGDEHAIKLTQACLWEYDLRADPAYLAASIRASDLLPS